MPASESENVAPDPPADDGSASPDPGDASATVETLKARIRGAAGWTMGSYSGTQLVRLASNLVLTRLMYAEAFGLMVLVGVFLQGLALFSDVGIGPSVVQNPRGHEPRFVNTAWTMQVFRGTTLWLITLVGAAPFAAIYDTPELVQLIPIAGLTVMLDGFLSTKLITARRDLKVARLAIVEIAAQVIGAGIMIGWATVDRSVWALVAGSVGISFCKMSLSHLVLPGVRNRFCFDRDAAREIFRFGRWVFLSTALYFVASQSDRLLFGKLITLGMLGIYHIALTVAAMPQQALGHVANTVLLPVLSRASEGKRENFNEVFWSTRRPILMLGGYLFSGFIAGGQPIVDILYDARYAEGGWILSLLSMGNWLALLQATITQALLARGHSVWLAASSATRVVAIIVFLPLGYWLGDFPGAVLGFAFTNGIQLMVLFAAGHRLGLRGFTGDFKMTVRLAVASAAGYAAILPLPSGTYGLPYALLSALVVFLVVTAVWLPEVLRFQRERKARTAA